MTELCDLVIGERNEDLSVCALGADDVEYAEAYIVDAVLAVHHGRNGHGRVDSREKRLYDVADRYRNGIEGRALALDDTCARLADIGLDVVEVKLRTYGVVVGDELVALGERNVRDVCDRPRNEGRIAVLTMTYACTFCWLIL